AAPAGRVSRDPARAGDGAGRGGRPAHRRAGLPGVRRAVGETGLACGRPAGWPGAAIGVLAGPQRGLRAGRVHPPGSPPRPPGAGRAAVFAVVDAAFAQRRKTLRAALAGWAGSPARAEEILRAAGIDPGSRGEALDVAAFTRIAATAAAHRDTGGS